MKIFYGINRDSGTRIVVPAEELRVVCLREEDTLPPNARMLDILSVHYRIGDGGRVKLLKTIPGEDSSPNPRFWAYLLGETLYLNNDRGTYAIDLTQMRALTRSRRPIFLTRSQEVRGKRRRRRGLRHYYTLDFRRGETDWKLLLPDWSLPTLCALTGWAVTDDGRVEFHGKKTQQMVRGMSRCGGCF